jgi:hypothetical protein
MVTIDAGFDAGFDAGYDAGVNQPPTANDDTLTTDEDVPADAPVLANDTDDRPGLTVTAVTQPDLGTVSINVDNTVRYEPPDNQSGQTSFTYTISDGEYSDTATVSVTVNAVDDPPTARDDSFTVDEDATTSLDVVANDTDIDNALTPTVLRVSVGIATVVGDEIEYTPPDDFVGTVFLVYRVNGFGDSRQANVTITVTNLDDPVVALDDAVRADVGVDRPIRLRATDVDGDTLTFTIVTPPTSGTLSADTDGDDLVVYTPPQAGGGQQDSFVFQVDDGTTQSTATVSVNLNKAWWDNAFTHRQRILVDGVGLVGHVDDAPVLVRLDATRTDMTLVGGGVRFVSMDEEELPFELEVLSAGEVVAWVRLPEAHAGSADAYFWAYLNGVPAGPAPSATDVWTSYGAVWHANGDYVDATGNGNDGASGIAGIDGAAGQAFDCDGAGLVTFDSSATISPVGAYTHSFAFRVPTAFDGTAASQLLVSQTIDGDRDMIIALVGADWGSTNNSPAGSLAVKLENPIGPRYTRTPATTWEAGRWYHLTVVSDPDSLALSEIYVDGVAQSLGGSAFTFPLDLSYGADLTACGGLADAANFPGGSGRTTADIDELRVTGALRDAAWVSLQSASVLDALLLYDTPEAR